MFTSKQRPRGMHPAVICYHLVIPGVFSLKLTSTTVVARFCLPLRNLIIPIYKSKLIWRLPFRRRQFETLCDKLAYVLLMDGANNFGWQNLFFERCLMMRALLMRESRRFVNTQPNPIQTLLLEDSTSTQASSCRF